MVRTIKRLTSFGLLILFSMNLWMWSQNLPFANYIESFGKITVLQGIHAALILAEMLVLLWLGKALSKLKSGVFHLVNQWLLTVSMGVLLMIVSLIAQQQFPFSDFLNAILPILRDTSPLLSAIILATPILPLIAKQSPSFKLWLCRGIEIIFLSTTIFNQDIWGLNSEGSLLPYLGILLLGAAITQTKVSKRKVYQAVLILISGIALVMLMPTFSHAVHYDYSTANRLSVISNGCLLLGAVAFAELFDFNEISEGGLRRLIIPLVSLLTFPLTIQWVVQWVANYPSGLIFKICLAFGISVVAIILAISIGKGWEVVSKHLLMNLPNSPVMLINSVKRKLWQLRYEWLAIFVLYVVSIVSFLAMATNWKISSGINASNAIALIIGTRQGMLMITTLLLWLVFKTLQACTNRYWVSLALVTVSELIWTVATRLKINARDEPILPAEVRMVDAYGSIFQMVSVWIFVVALIAVLLTLGIVWYLERYHPVTVTQRPFIRIMYFVLTILIFGSSNWWNHTQNPITVILNGFGNSASFYNQLYGAQMNGPLIQFLNNVDVTVMEKPKGYSKHEMAKVAQEYEVLAKTINQERKNNLSKQTVVFNLSESFADPRRIPGIKVTPNPMPKIDQIKQQTTSGLMISSGYGGGTANIEYMTLTGLATANFMPTLSTPYTQLVPFLTKVWSFNQQFNFSMAIHPFVGTFYSRVAVYDKFGFNQFSYLGSQYKISHKQKLDQSPLQSDRTTYLNALDQLKKRNAGQFINLISIQNHYPYDRGYYTLSSKYHVKVTNETSRDNLKNYVAGIHYTDQAVGQFIKQLDQLKQPVTVVFYGDHLPGIYANSFAEDGLKLHETDYFIYSNRAARAQGAHNLTHNTKYIAPNDFIAMVAEQTNSKVTPYLAFLTAAYHDLPVETMNTNGTSTASYQADPQFVSRQGKIISQKQFTKRQQQLFHDYQLIQYDLTAGKQYLFKFWQMK